MLKKQQKKHVQTLTTTTLDIVPHRPTLHESVILEKTQQRNVFCRKH